MALAEGRVTRPATDASYGVYRILTHGILVMVVVFFLFGDRIILDQLSDWLRVARLVALVYPTCVVHCVKNVRNQLACAAAGLPFAILSCAKGGHFLA
jgi:hypothetical protein